MVSGLPKQAVANLQQSLATTAYTSGSTHHFYHYPARFHPEVARQVIRGFSRRGGWVLDPFMGGGTSVVEGLALGRRMIGGDINTLARFVADVRTRPLSPADERAGGGAVPRGAGADPDRRGAGGDAAEGGAAGRGCVSPNRVLKK